MPIRDSSNNRILPANARAADVAERAINEIIPVQQRRYYDAFRPQGIKCVLYNRLKQGRKCTCKSSAKTLNSLLGKDGKAEPGVINQMLTGQMEFSVTDYAQGKDRLFGPDVKNTPSPSAPENKYQGVFDIATVDPDSNIPFADFMPAGGTGDNGPVDPVTIDDLIGDWDAGVMGHSDMACPVCFGSGFIGGYSPFNTHRSVLTVADLQLDSAAELDTISRPWAAQASGFDAIVTIPRGALQVDSFRVWNGVKPVNASFTIDGKAIKSTVDILALADGKRHLVHASFDSRFTHFEMQYVLSTQCSYFEFPRRPSSNDTSLLEQMEPFQIILSPDIPQIDSQDMITECQQGKTLIVTNSNPWESRKRQTLGWEVQVRVLQPAEIARILPRRYRALTKDRTTSMVRDNQSGPRRT
jgi:hypothetical protein